MTLLPSRRPPACVLVPPRRRIGPVAGQLAQDSALAALIGLVSGWASARSDESAPLWTSPRRRSLVLAKDVAVGAVLTTGLASATGGVGFAQQAANGAVPMVDGTELAPSTPPRARSLKHLVNLLGALNLASELCLLGVNVVLSRSASRRLVAR